MNDWPYWELGRLGGEHLIELMEGEEHRHEDTCSTWGFDYVNCISILTEEDHYPQTAQQCLAALGGSYYHCFPDDKRVGVVCANMYGDEDGPVDDDLAIKYLDWLANRSGYAPGFVSKDAKQIMEVGYSVHRADVPSNLMVGGLVAKRRIWETTSVLYKWEKLVSLGVDESIAFLVAHQGYVDKDVDGDTYRVDMYLDSHVSVNLENMGHISVKNFVNGKVTTGNPPYDVDPSYGGIDELWQDGREAGPNLYIKVRDRFTELCEGEEKAVSVNPFPLPDGDNKYKHVEYEEAMATLAVVCKEIEEEWL